MRRHALLGIVAVVWGVSVGRAALGQAPDDVDRIESLAEQADFDHAEAAATHALSTGELSLAAAARVYLVLGTIAAARGKPEDAEAFFHEALVRSPRVSLPPSAGPHVRASFSRARAALAEEEAASAPSPAPHEPVPPPSPVTPPTPAAREEEASSARVAPARPVPTSVWIAGVATGGLAVGTAILSVIALNKRAAFDQANADPQQTVGERSSLRDSALTFEHAATIAFATTFVSAAASAILYFNRPAAPRPVSVSTLPEAGGATLLLSGRF